MKSGLTGHFVGTPLVEYVDGNVWKLVQNHDSLFGLIVDGVGWIAPENGFYFDFASVPIPIRWIYPKTGDGGKGEHYGAASIIHDWLYSYPKIHFKPIDRKLADRIFLLGMEISGVRPTLRSLFYAAVRVGGIQYFGNPDRLNKLRGTK